MRLGYIFVGTNKDPPLPHLISNMRSYNIFYCLLYLMVTFLFDISLKEDYYHFYPGIDMDIKKEDRFAEHIRWISRFKLNL